MDGVKRHKIQESMAVAFLGILKAIREERNVRIELAFAATATLAGLFFNITKGEWLVLVLTIFTVVSAEIFNSAIEALCNLVRDEDHLAYEETKAVRDISAGAVLFLAMGSVIIGLLIFLPYLNSLFQ